MLNLILLGFNFFFVLSRGCEYNFLQISSFKVKAGYENVQDLAGTYKFNQRPDNI
jgi:hypothetical protein